MHITQSNAQIKNTFYIYYTVLYLYVFIEPRTCDIINRTRRGIFLYFCARVMT